MRRNALSIAFELAWLLVAFCRPSPASPAEKGSITLEGEITVGNGRAPSLKLEGKVIPVSGANESVTETLQDPRISGKHLKLLGEYRNDGSFVVTDLFVVHTDGLYRIIYYCHVCNITAFKPGNCVCCQRPTEMQEVPLTDPRVYHEDVQDLPAKNH